MRSASCRAPSANHEDPFIGGTIDAVKKPSETHNQFMSAVLQRTFSAARQAVAETVAMERSSGKEKRIDGKFGK